jgi:hypothetical protein
MTAQIIPFRKPRLRDWAAQRAAAVDAQVCRHLAEAFRHDRDAGALEIWLDDSPQGRMVLFMQHQTQARIYL